jgi:flagellar biosynthetic protein FliQ
MDAGSREDFAASQARRGRTHGWVGNMTIDSANDLIAQALLLSLLIAGPMLIIGLLVGVIISLVQAVTQIQEQTLSFVPKITAMIMAAILLMPWMQSQMLDYASMVFKGTMFH